MEKTLTVVIGNPRGGEKAWNSMYRNLLEPYQSDLALCFGCNENKCHSLYSKGKYIWEVPEYEEWADYYVENFGEGSWKQSFELGSKTGFSGLYGTIGSSAITLALRHYLLKNKKEVLLNYDRIILTRSDHFYVQEHPILPNDFFWVPYGEEYGGISDRHHIFPSSDIDIVLGIIDNYVNTEYLIQDFWEMRDDPFYLNIERSYVYYFNRIGYFNKVKKLQNLL